MTISPIPDITPALVANGSTRTWDFDFAFQAKEHVHLLRYAGSGEEEISQADFDVTDPGPDGGTVTYPRSPIAAEVSPVKFRIALEVPNDQPFRIGNQGSFYPQTHEDALDYIAMQIQRLAWFQSQTFYLPDFPNPGISDYTLPQPAQGYPLVWGANGIINGTVSLLELQALFDNAQAASELALGYAAISSAILSTISEIAALAASGGVVDAASLVTYSGSWSSTNVQDALDESKAASDATNADVDALQASVTALQAQVASILAAGVTVPIGTMIAYPGNAPLGWKLCFGQSVGKAGSGADLAGAGYQTLFNVLGGMLPNTGAEVFSTGGLRVLPDMRGRVALGRDNMGGPLAGRVSASGAGNPNIAATTRGQAGGVDRHTLVLSQMPAHGHPFLISTSAGGDNNTGGLTVNADDTALEDAFTGTPGAPLGHQIGGAGSSAAHPNVQPSLVVDWIIYTGVFT